MKKTVILIHGYLTDYHDFSQLPLHLSKYYDYVVILDLPGHGKYQDNKKFTVNDTIKKVENEVEFYLNKGSVDLIGYSMGGALSRYLAIKYPNINKVVLLAPATKYLTIFFPIERARYIFSDKDKNKRKVRIQEIKEHDKVSYLILKKGPLPRFKLRNGYVFCKLIYTINKIRGKNTRPTLIIRGRLDELVPHSSAKYCYKNCVSDNKELYIVDNIGHIMLRSNEEEIITSKIIDFLTK